MQRHAFRVGHPHRFIALTDRNACNRHTVTKARNAVTPFQKRRFRRRNAVSELKRRYFVAGPQPASTSPLGSWFSQQAERIVRPFFSIPTISIGLIVQDRQRMVETRRIDPNLAGADAFEHESQLLDGRMDEVY
jgi:hypothetical protein